MNEELSLKIAAADEVRDEYERLRSENRDLSVLVDRYRGSLPVLWVAGALLVVFAAGGLLGMWWVDRSIRRRFGGHRIY